MSGGGEGGWAMAVGLAGAGQIRRDERTRWVGGWLAGGWAGWLARRTPAGPVRTAAERIRLPAACSPMPPGSAPARPACPPRPAGPALTPGVPAPPRGVAALTPRAGPRVRWWLAVRLPQRPRRAGRPGANSRTGCPNSRGAARGPRSVRWSSASASPSPRPCIPLPSRPLPVAPRLGGPPPRTPAPAAFPRSVVGVAGPRWAPARGQKSP